MVARKLRKERHETSYKAYQALLQLTTLDDTHLYKWYDIVLSSVPSLTWMGYLWSVT